MTTTDKISTTSIDDGLGGTVALVTGAARGNGEAQAKVLANAGAEVFVTDVLEEEAEATVADIEAEGGTAHFHHLDVSSEAGWEMVIGEIGDTAGRLDVLVNNAGIASEGTATTEEVEVWDQVLDINLKGVWLGMKHAIPLMDESGGGSVINISSVYGLRGSTDGSATAYQASKGGVTLLTKNAANAYADSVRVNSIHPGYIVTPMTEAAGEEMREMFLEQTPMGRSGTPAEVAKAVYFLASDLSTFVTGENLVVDGGYLAH